MTTTKDWANWYIDNGWVPIPVGHKTKEPLENSWNETTLEVAFKNLDKSFPDGVARNIGVLLGAASAGLVDIDLDCREAREIAKIFLPETLVFGRKSAPASHWLYRCDGIPSYKFVDPLAKDSENEEIKKKSVILEIRAGGKKGKTVNQTVMPPSVHVSGEDIEFEDAESDKTPAPIELLALQRRVHLHASAALLGRYWPSQGTRHDTAKACAGMLAYGGCSRDEALEVILSAAVLGMDDELDDREQVVRDTYDKFENGEEVTGAPTLEGYIDEQIVKRVRAWACTKLIVDPSSPKLTDGTDGIHPLTDAANGQRFIAQHIHEARYVIEWKKWIVWTGTHWDINQIRVWEMALETAKSIFQEAAAAKSAEVSKALRSWARTSQSNTCLFKMIEAAAHDSRIAIKSSDLDKNVDLIACPNGTINLKTYTLQPSNPEDFITRLCPTEFNPTAACPLWEKTVSEVMGGDQELVEFFQIALGYSFSGCQREEGLFIAYGTGANGKSTILRVIQDVMGEAHTCTVPSEVLLLKQGQSHPTGLTIMHGKRLAISVEPEMNRALAEGLVKSLTGGDKIAARRMNEDFWEYKPIHTIWLATNHKPNIRGTDNGIWRRIWPIPFSVTFTKPDKHLSDKLKAEREGILAWLAMGAHCYHQYPDMFKLPAACQDFKDAYRTEEDRLGVFVDDCIERVEGEKTPTRKIWQVYTNWCSEESEDPLPKKMFFKMLEERGFPQTRSNGDRLRVNLKLKGALVATINALQPLRLVKKPNE